MHDFLLTLVSIKTKVLPRFPRISKKPHAMSGAQKNPRRELILTGINANNSKLKYGECSFSSTMLIFKQAVNRQKTALFLSKAAIKQLKGPLFCFSQVGTKWRELMLYKATIKRGKILSNRRQAGEKYYFPCKTG